MQYRHEFGLTDIPAPLRHLYFQWIALKEPGRIPELPQIKFDVLLEDDHALVLTEVIRDAKQTVVDFEFVFFGSAVARASTANLTGKRYSAVPGKGPDSNIWQLFRMMAGHRNPVLAAQKYVGPKTQYQSTRELLCPLCDADGTQTVRYVLADVMLSADPVPTRPEDIGWTAPR